MPNLLIEIGTEELPVDMLDVVYGELAAKTREALDQNRLTYDAVEVDATPRRIALFIEGIEARQKDQTLELSGPSVEKAYDPAGKPTPALEGFLKSKGAALKDVQVRDTARGKFIFVIKNETGKKAEAVIPPMLESIAAALGFPKMMRWEPSGARFPRPVRWLVMLLDKKVVPAKIGNVRSGALTYGHRFLAPRAVKLLSADWTLYRKTLRRLHVILDREERKELIRKALSGRFHQKHFDEGLVHITAQLVEEPFLVQGSFSKAYLDLPAEVLASCMKKNQKIFALYDADDRLNARFAAVLNGRRSGLSGIVGGYENVLESRLHDARYFYDADTKTPLESKMPLLAQVTYLGKLGNMLQKTERMEKLAGELTGLIARKDLAKDLARAARLSKIDLMTKLVYEFPDLQGIVGREYLLAAGEKEDVAHAVGTQYLPKSLSEDYQHVKKQLRPLGALLGILDRLDLLVGAFGTGLDPTGSQDPYALRRAGGSIVKIIRAFRFPFSLAEIIEKNAEAYGQSLDAKNVTGRLMKFFEDRITAELQVKPGSRHAEILTAVLRTSSADVADALNRFESLSRLYEHDPDNFLKTAKVVERTGNILKGVKDKPVGDVNPALLSDGLEKHLFQLCEDRESEIRETLKSRDYEKATLIFGKIFYGTLHDFFNQVMVNVEDPAIRANRHALMKRVNRLYTEKVADLSALSRLDQG